MDLKTAMSKIAVRRDGTDHIWVSPFGATQLGKYVSLKWRKKFFIPQLGEFISPEAFVAWLFTGDESMRQNPTAKLPHLSKDDFRLSRAAMFFAKYHQLAALKIYIVKECAVGNGEKSKMDITWIEYKQHQSGIKEHHPDTKRVSIVKSMVRHLLDNGAKTPFMCEDFDYVTVREQIMNFVQEKFGLEPIAEETPPESGETHDEIPVEQTGESAQVEAATS